jgi:hypothetical protein
VRSSIKVFANDLNGLLRMLFSKDNVIRTIMSESTRDYQRMDRNLQGHGKLRRAPGDEFTRKVVSQTVIDVLRSPGQPLESRTRKFIESRFDCDFDRVRVHADTQANRSARALNALAYTVGCHLVFDTGRYAPATTAGRRLLAHELTHAIQQGQATEIDPSDLSVGAVDDIYELQANSVGEALAALEQVRFTSNSVKQAKKAVQALLSPILQTESPSIRRQPPPGICGPDVTAQVASIWAKIQTDFHSWTPSQREDACTRVLVPVHMPVWTPGGDIKKFLRSAADINGWDVLPLFQGDSLWLRSYPVYDAATGGPCATPSSLNPSAPAFDDAHESDQTCSDTVQVGDQCWLNGTVNYGTYGIVVRLCHDEFPIKFAFALEMAEALIRTYKAIGPHPEDPTLPLAWLRATYHGGPGAKPANPGNRLQCRCSCPCNGSITTWDYVWEPVKPRSAAKHPSIPPKPAPMPPPAPAPPTVKTYSVLPGDSLSKIAQKFYGNPSLWSKIYQANKALIGPNPNLIIPGQKLTIP